MLARQKKKILIGILILLIPIIIPFITTIIDIFFSLGQYFGTIARNVSGM